MKKIVLITPLILIAVALLVARILFSPAGVDTQLKVFTVQPGLGAGALAGPLSEQGFLRHPLAWKIHLKMNTNRGTIKAGKHMLSNSMDLGEIYQALVENPLVDDVAITMIEGWRLGDADDALSSAGHFPKGEYLAAAQKISAYDLKFPLNGASSLSGYLLPDTYRVQKSPFSTQTLVRRQLEAFTQKFYQANKEEIDTSGRSLKDIVIMASLLEREEPKPQVRPQVAGVLYKRLDSNTPLGVDATSRYTLLKWNDRKAFLKKLRDPTDPYNTRLKAGLPPTPIGAPSLASLMAALRPQKNPYWYYLHDKDQNIHFGRNGQEHETNRKTYDVW